MKTSAAGRAKIIAREGSRLTAYRDQKGILTIGVGHTGRMTPPKVVPGMTITQAECDAFLAADLGPVEAVINAAVRVPLSQNEFDALASLGFNIGAGGLRTSTVIKRLNVGDIAGAANAFRNWSKPVSLAARREAERRQFLTPDAPQPMDANPTKTISSARSVVLKDRAAQTKAKARSLESPGVGVVTAASAVFYFTPHHWNVALIVFGVMLMVGVVAGVVALFMRRQSAVLASNADAQAAQVR